VGFRNVLVHEYQRIGFHLMIEVIENRLDDLLLFTDFILKEFPNGFGQLKARKELKIEIPAGCQILGL
jgi:hypothetical protein